MANKQASIFIFFFLLISSIFSQTVNKSGKNIKKSDQLLLHNQGSVMTSRKYLQLGEIGEVIAEVAEGAEGEAGAATGGEVIEVINEGDGEGGGEDGDRGVTDDLSDDADGDDDDDDDDDDKKKKKKKKNNSGECTPTHPLCY